MKATYREVKDLIKWGKENPTILGKQPRIFQTGYFTPSSANWSYIIGLTNINGQDYEVVTQFGAIVGSRLAYMPKETHND